MSESFRDFVHDQLRGLAGVECRGMFGGHGLYLRGVFFGIVHGDTLYLKTSEATRPRYESRGMEPFRPHERQTLRTYYRVPAGVLEDPDELEEWAREAAAAAGARRSPA